MTLTDLLNPFCILFGSLSLVGGAGTIGAGSDCYELASQGNYVPALVVGAVSLAFAGATVIGVGSTYHSASSM